MSVFHCTLIVQRRLGHVRFLLQSSARSQVGGEPDACVHRTPASDGHVRSWRLVDPVSFGTGVVAGLWCTGRLCPLASFEPPVRCASLGTDLLRQCSCCTPIGFWRLMVTGVSTSIPLGRGVPDAGVQRTLASMGHCVLDL